MSMILILTLIFLLLSVIVRAAPTPSTRVDPTSATVIMLRNGYRALITFAYDTNIEFWEISVGVPGYEGGGKIPTSTMFNSQMRTSSPHALVGSKSSKHKCAYDPIVMDSVRSLINRETTITHLFPDGSTYCYFGFADDAEFDPLEEGKRPEMTLTTEATHWDPTNKVEANPVYTGVTGT